MFDYWVKEKAEALKYPAGLAGIFIIFSPAELS